MNIVDAAIIVLLIIFGLIGFKRGFFKEVVVVVGSILVFVLAYYFKDYIANFLSYNLPFFSFKGQFAGLSTLNIILYQMLAFIITMAGFSIVLAILIKISGLIEKILKMTVVLSIPSKIVGFVLGLVEGYVVIFIALFVLNQPALNIEIINESKFMPTIVSSSPGLSKMVKGTEDSIIEIYKYGKDYVDQQDKDTFNTKTIDILLKNKIITVEYVEKLIAKNKINIENIDVILNQYR